MIAYVVVVVFGLLVKMLVLGDDAGGDDVACDVDGGVHDMEPPFHHRVFII